MRLMGECIIDGCENNKEYNPGICRKHYLRMQKHGSYENPRKSLEDRFLAKIELVPFSTCWWWVGGVNSNGYGQIRVGNKMDSAHRVSFELYNEKTPVGLNILHGCDNPLCVNPAHLRAGTQQENIMDMVLRRRRKTKLNEKQVLEIRRLSHSGLSFTRIGKMYRVNETTIGRIVSRKTWQHI